MPATQAIARPSASQPRSRRCQWGATDLAKSEPGVLIRQMSEKKAGRRGRRSAQDGWSEAIPVMITPYIDGKAIGFAGTQPVLWAGLWRPLQLGTFLAHGQ